MLRMMIKQRAINKCPVKEMKSMRLLLVLLVSATAGFVFAEEAAVSPTQMRRIASDMLRAEAVANSAVDKADAIAALCDAYVAIRMHPSYEQSEVLRSEGAQVRRRLITANRKLTDQLERDHISKPVSLSRRVDAAIESESRNPSNANNMATKSDAEARIVIANNAGTSGQGFGGAGPGGADESWALVELIQRTIRPDFWEVTGGPGSIRYFAMRRVLVVRATTQVHEELAALLRSL